MMVPALVRVEGSIEIDSAKKPQENLSNDVLMHILSDVEFEDLILIRGPNSCRRLHAHVKVIWYACRFAYRDNHYIYIYS